MKSRKRLTRVSSRRIFKKGARQRSENAVITSSRGGYRL
jgi:hypothetical protein